MGISLRTALEESKRNSNENTISELYLLERNVLCKLEDQVSTLYLKALNDECLPIVCTVTVDKRQEILLNIDTANSNEVRESLK